MKPAFELMMEHQARMLVDQANRQMENIGKNLLASGRATTIQQAVKIACDEHGKTMADGLQASLRLMGAHDVRVTCP